MKKILLFALMSGVLAVESAHAFNPQPDPPGFGLIGLTASETLRLNVSNITAAGPQKSPPDPCKVEITFLDGAGVELLPAVQITLKPGTSTSVDLNGADITRGVTGVDSTNAVVLSRVEVHPVIKIIPNARDAQFPPGPCVSTIELIDNQTGRTFLTSGPQKPGAIFEFNPQPDPPGDITFGLVGIVPGQTLRLTALNSSGEQNFPPDPCRVTLTILNDQGHVVVRSSEVLKAGSSTFLDLPLAAEAPPIDTNAVAAGPASQLQLRGIVTVERVNGRQAPPDPCHASLEVFDQATGRTTALLSPQHVPLKPPGPSN
jgi:hypothetical protein